MSFHLAHARYGEMCEQKFDVAIVPLGTCEPHNFHLPYATDALHTTQVAHKIAEAATQKSARVVVLPTIPFGVQTNMRALPLAINLNPTTLFRVLDDVVASLRDGGIDKVVLLNGHGGNDFLKPFIREHMSHGDASFICTVDWWRVGSDMYSFIFEKTDDHGGELETSVMLHLYPELVKMDEAGKGSVNQTRFEAINRGWVSISRPWHLLTDDTGSGDPRAATAEKGERYLQVVVERLSEFVIQLAREPLDDAFPF